jgi:hypothetical protein
LTVSSNNANKRFINYFTAIQTDKITIITMKVLLEIKDDKVDFIMELLHNFKFVKAKPLSPYKAGVLKGVKEAVEEVNQIKDGKKKSQPLSEFLDDL